MKFEIKAWPDTGNIDLKLSPESESDRVAILAMHDRFATFQVISDGAEIVFRPISK